VDVTDFRAQALSLHRTEIDATPRWRWIRRSRIERRIQATTEQLEGAARSFEALRRDFIARGYSPDAATQMAKTETAQHFIDRYS
jgi:hypothetical protein